MKNNKLVIILIIVMLLIVGGIIGYVVCSKGEKVDNNEVNKKAENTDTAFKATDTSLTKNVVITYKTKNGTGVETRIEVPTNYYETENDYRYYEAK